jgi:2-methylisocitrate lyase-like PEP mutase family enzyme
MSSEFAAMHVPGNPLLLPNAWDYASAAMFAASGFAAIGSTSLGVAAAAGVPDATGVSWPQTRALAAALRTVPALISMDAEGGFSDEPAQVAEMVAELAKLGVVGVNLEDVRPDGTLRSADKHAKIVAACRASAPAMFINARTDPFWLATVGVRPASAETCLAEALTRAAAYADAGANGIFVPAVTADQTIEALASRISLPLNVLFLPGRHTLPQLAGLGVARVSLGSLPFRAALHAATELAEAVRAGEPVSGSGVPGYADVQRCIESTLAFKR